MICREGDYGSTAFFIVEGLAQVAISTPIAHVKTNGGARGFFKKLTSVLVGREEDKRDEESEGPDHPHRCPRGFGLWESSGRVGAGGLVWRNDVHEFLSAVRHGAAQKRTSWRWKCCATCWTSCMKNKTFRAQLDANYRRRALEIHLRGVPMFAGLAPDFIDHLQGKAWNWCATRRDRIIARQGEAADSFYLVRIGFVKVAQEVSRRRTGARVSVARRLFRRDRACWAAVCVRRHARRWITWRWCASAETISAR